MSAVDEYQEKLITERLLKRKDMTIISITHRRQIAEKYEKVVKIGE